MENKLSLKVLKRISKATLTSLDGSKPTKKERENFKEDIRYRKKKEGKIKTLWYGVLPRRYRMTKSNFVFSQYRNKELKPISSYVSLVRNKSHNNFYKY